MIAIITDSTCDIPEELIAQYKIIVVPQYIIWGGRQYKDRVDLQPNEFYERLVSEKVRPTTSQATEMDFKEAVENAVSQGADNAIILTVSSAMSGTYQMALAAAESAKIPVTVIDSKGPTMSLGWQVLTAARARDAGADVSEIIEQIAKVRQNLVQIVAMDTLEYLEKGGRIGDAAKWIGTMLKVRPVVSINHKTGKVQPEGLVRSRKGAVDMLYRKFFNSLGDINNFRIAVLHGDAIEDAHLLEGRIREAYEPLELIINITGPVLGINTGPGALALCGYAEA